MAGRWLIAATLRRSETNRPVTNSPPLPTRCLAASRSIPRPFPIRRSRENAFAPTQCMASQMESVISGCRAATPHPSHQFPDWPRHAQQRGLLAQCKVAEGMADLGSSIMGQVDLTSSVNSGPSKGMSSQSKRAPAAGRHLDFWHKSRSRAKRPRNSAAAAISPRG